MKKAVPWDCTIVPSHMAGLTFFSRVAFSHCRNISGWNTEVATFQLQITAVCLYECRVSISVVDTSTLDGTLAFAQPGSTQVVNIQVIIIFAAVSQEANITSLSMRTQ